METFDTTTSPTFTTKEMIKGSVAFLFVVGALLLLTGIQIYQQSQNRKYNEKIKTVLQTEQREQTKQKEQTEGSKNLQSNASTPLTPSVHSSVHSSMPTKEGETKALATPVDIEMVAPVLLYDPFLDINPKEEAVPGLSYLNMSKT